MSSKKEKKLSTKNDELKKALSSVRAQLKKSEAKLAKANDKSVKSKADGAAARTAIKEANAKADKLQGERDEAIAAAQAAQTVRTDGHTANESDAADAQTDTDTAQPDASWTLFQLRAEARARGLTGITAKRKAELLSAIRSA